MTDESISDYDLGFNSPHWMLKAIVANSDENLLRYAIMDTINYFVYNPEPQIEVAFDVLAQTAVRGYWSATVEHPCDVDEDHFNPSLDPTQRNYDPEKVLGEDEIDQAVADFRARLDSVGTDDEKEEQ